MKSIQVKKYKKELEYSYALGVYPCLELIKYHPKTLQLLVLHTTTKNNKGAQKLATYAREHAVRVELNDGLLKGLSETENIYALCVFQKYEQSINTETSHVVLYQPTDRGNLGTIVRTATGFGIKNIAIIKPGVDVFHPRVIRSSMGSVFQTNISYFASLEDYQVAFPEYTLYAFDGHSKEELQSVVFDEKSSFIFGSEGAGLPQSVKQNIKNIRINFSNTIDSLNVATAVGIVLYKNYLI
ncbi:MAG: TrmH family RNA methyltransferase [Candidatus Roizmanbacteria bacterium]